MESRSKLIAIACCSAASCCFSPNQRGRSALSSAASRYDSARAARIVS